MSGPEAVAAPGPTNSLVDVAGLRVGHCTRDEPGWLTGVTVVVAPPGGVVAGVDVRGGGPGTRETDVLDPRNLLLVVPPGDDLGCYRDRLTPLRYLYGWRTKG